MNVVSIMAHQDDEMRCLGTMLKCRERGDRLTFITLTDGSNGLLERASMQRGDAARVREAEMTRLAQAVDARYVSLGEHDEFLYDTPDVRMRLIEAMRAAGAELIFTHYHEDYNLDHVTTHRLVQQCAMQSCLPMLATDAPPLADHPAVFCVEPHGPVVFAATHFVDISVFEARKVELLRHHESQEAAMQQAVGAGFDDLCGRPDAYWGQKVGCDYAECFVAMAARGAVKPFAVLP
ncbi:MAG: PIG-L family deacetylase [Phycisphaeraceae bacterium]